MRIFKGYAKIYAIEYTIVYKSFAQCYKLLGPDAKLLGPEAKRERLLSMGATISGLHLCIFLRAIQAY